MKYSIEIQDVKWSHLVVEIVQGDDGKDVDFVSAFTDPGLAGECYETIYRSTDGKAMIFEVIWDDEGRNYTLVDKTQSFHKDLFGV